MLLELAACRAALPREEPGRSADSRSSAGVRCNCTETAWPSVVTMNRPPPQLSFNVSLLTQYHI